MSIVAQAGSPAGLDISTLGSMSRPQVNCRLWIQFSVKVPHSWVFESSARERPLYAQSDTERRRNAKVPGTHRCSARTSCDRASRLVSTPDQQTRGGHLSDPDERLPPGGVPEEGQVNAAALASATPGRYVAVEIPFDAR